MTLRELHQSRHNRDFKTTQANSRHVRQNLRKSRSEVGIVMSNRGLVLVTATKMLG
jgi:hypothetical protein